jgi:hypothetical protein
MRLLLKIVPYLRKISFFEFLANYRTYIAGALGAYTGLVGLIYGAVPVMTGSGITWIDMSPEASWMTFIGGLAAIGIGGKLDKLSR